MNQVDIYKKDDMFPYFFLTIYYLISRELASLLKLLVRRTNMWQQR